MEAAEAAETQTAVVATANRILTVRGWELRSRAAMVEAVVLPDRVLPDRLVGQAVTLVGLLSITMVMSRSPVDRR